MNKAELVDAIAHKTGGSRAAAQAGLDATLEAITESLQAGGSVVLTGFGTFEVTDRPERMGRNPQTGEALRIKAAKVPKFRPGKGLRDAL